MAARRPNARKSVFDPGERQVLLAALRPPDGYSLDFALGTTYTLDLRALLTAPVGFTLFDLEKTPEDPDQSLPLLQAVRRYAKRVTIFCQGGGISIPPKYQLLYNYLEDSVVPVHAPKGGVFHPKVWAIRYTKGSDVRYRLLCMSRNLTFVQTWDTMLVLEGRVIERSRGFGSQRVLGEFFATLPSLANSPVTATVETRASTVASELRRTEFDVPEGFERILFHTCGLPQSRRWVPAKIDRALVVSPFLTEDALDEFRGEAQKAILISRAPELDRLSSKALRGFDAYCLSVDAPVGDPQATDYTVDDAVPTAGLHAKIYVLDAGWNAHVITGSMNATSAGFDRNVEFLTELIGKKAQVGIEKLFSTDGSEPGLRDLVSPYSSGGLAVTESTEDRLDRRLELIRHELGKLKWTISIESASQGSYDFAIRANGRLPKLAANEGVFVWPISLRSTMSLPIDETVVFEKISGLGLTSFVAFSATISEGVVTRTTEFVCAAEFLNPPPGRDGLVLRELLKDDQQVVQLLLLLLYGPQDQWSLPVSVEGEEGQGAGNFAFLASSALLEPMLRALVNDPMRLEAVESVVHELEHFDGGTKLPPGWQTVWEPIWKAHQRRRDS